MRSYLSLGAVLLATTFSAHAASTARAPDGGFIVAQEDTDTAKNSPDRPTTQTRKGGGGMSMNRSGKMSMHKGKRKVTKRHKMKKAM
jgi:hypothetical protein